MNTTASHQPPYFPLYLPFTPIFFLKLSIP